MQLVGRFWVFFLSRSPGWLGKPAGKVAQGPHRPLVPLSLWSGGRGTVGAGPPPSATAPSSSVPLILGLREPDLLPHSPSSQRLPIQGRSCEGAFPMGTCGCPRALARFYLGGGAPTARPWKWVSIVVLFPPLHVGHPLGFAPEAALEDLGCPCEGQVWRWCSCLGCSISGSTRYSGELEARAAENTVL